MAHDPRTHEEEETMSKSSVARPRSGKIGEPQRKWYIAPKEIPVPPPAREDRPTAPEPLAQPEPSLAPEPERVRA
jgi:hypothetical protein